MNGQLEHLEYQEGMAFLRHFDITILAIQAFFIPLTIAGFTIKVKDNECSVIIVGITSILIWIMFAFITFKYIRSKINEIANYIKELQINNSGGLTDKLTPARINYSHFIFLVGLIICLLWSLRIGNILFSSCACVWNCFN